MHRKYKYFLENNEELQKIAQNNKIKLSIIVISKVSDLSNIFEQSTRKNFKGIESWNVSHVTNMACMFNGAGYFNADISSWNTSNVKNMRDMFYGAKSFNQDISAWNVSTKLDMRDMFNNSPLEDNPPVWYR